MCVLGYLCMTYVTMFVIYSLRNTNLSNHPFKITYVHPKAHTQILQYITSYSIGAIFKKNNTQKRNHSIVNHISQLFHIRRSHYYRTENIAHPSQPLYNYLPPLNNIQTHIIDILKIQMYKNNIFSRVTDYLTVKSADKKPTTDHNLIDDFHTFPINSINFTASFIINYIYNCFCG